MAGIKEQNYFAIRNIGSVFGELQLMPLTTGFETEKGENVGAWLSLLKIGNDKASFFTLKGLIFLFLQQSALRSLF